MRIRIYGEGESERAGLPKLLRLVNPSLVPVTVHPLKGGHFLPQIGFRAAGFWGSDLASCIQGASS